MNILTCVAVVSSLIAVVHCSTNCSGTSRHEGLLYPHMANNGDTEFLPREDDAKRTLPIQGQYKLFGQQYTDQMYVVSNGILAMKDTNIEHNYDPIDFTLTGNPFIAPAYSDVDIEYMSTRSYEGSHIWYRETDDRALRNRFKEDIGDYFDGCGILTRPYRLVIITWQRVQSYCDHFYIYDRKRDAGDKSDDDQPRSDDERYSAPINTFQLVYATNKRGLRSIAMFNYQCISWDFCWSYTRAGFNSGDGTTKHILYSGTPSFNTNDQNTNVGKPGRFMFSVGDDVIKKPDCQPL